MGIEACQDARHVVENLKGLIEQKQVGPVSLVLQVGPEIVVDRGQQIPAFLRRKVFALLPEQKGDEEQFRWGIGQPRDGVVGTGGKEGLEGHGEGDRVAFFRNGFGEEKEEPGELFHVPFFPQQVELKEKGGHLILLLQGQIPPAGQQLRGWQGHSFRLPRGRRRSKLRRPASWAGRRQSARLP